MEGLTTIQSKFGPKETMERLEKEIHAQGIRVLARINYSTAAAEVGLTLRPTELILFGNPRAGTPLMLADQTMGIDLPLKALVWQDASGKTWLSYSEPEWFARRHAMVGAERIVATMGLALSAMLPKQPKKNKLNDYSTQIVHAPFFLRRSKPWFHFAAGFVAFRNRRQSSRRLYRTFR